MVFKIKQKYFDELSAIVINRSGKIISNEVIDSRTKIIVRCNNGHDFLITPNKIKQNRWCPHCKKVTLENICEIVNNKGGKIFGEFKSIHSTMTFMCDKGHVWNTKITNIKYGNSWCPTCANRIKLNIDYFKNLAEIKGGKCLTDEYNNQQDKLKFVCANNHIWKSYAKHIRAGHWCPQCHIYRGEEIVRICLEYIFNSPFPKYKSDKLISSKNKRLELDGYNEQLGIAFEHDGLQHYGFNIFRVKNFEDGYKNIISNDLDKENICKKLGIKLIKVPAIGRLTKIEDLKYVLKHRFDILNIDIQVPNNIPNNIYDKISKKSLDEINNIAIKRGGKCISDIYINNRTYMIFECNNGHQWKSTSSNIKSGKWCKLCSYKRRKNNASK